jgi:hypothetical protein
MIEYCPHCGQKLSTWQQVLLNVDRALICKNCWYNIYLDKHVNKNNIDVSKILPETNSKKKEQEYVKTS